MRRPSFAMVVRSSSILASPFRSAQLPLGFRACPLLGTQSAGDQSAMLRSAVILRLVRTECNSAIVPPCRSQRSNETACWSSSAATTSAKSPERSARCCATIPTADLLDIEQLFRAAAGTAYLIVDDDGFHITIGMKNWIAELNALGRSPAGNRALLAREVKSE